MISFDHNDPSSAYGACPRFNTLLEALVHQAKTKPQSLGLADKARGLTFEQWALRIVATAHELKPELEAMGFDLTTAADELTYWIDFNYSAAIHYEIRITLSDVGTDNVPQSLKDKTAATPAA